MAVLQGHGASTLSRGVARLFSFVVDRNTFKVPRARQRFIFVCVVIVV